MMPKGPKIDFREPATLDWSVIIPVHRRREPDTLRRCLESVLPQLKAGIELVVVDHSDRPNPSLEIGPYMPVQFDYMRTDPTGSAAGDWNLALSHARGRWVHLLHDDDWVLPGFYDALRSGDCHYTGYRNVDPDGEVTFTRREPLNPHWPSIACGNFLQPPAFTCRRGVYERFGGYSPDPELRYCIDWEFFVRVSQDHATKWSATDKVLACYATGGDETLAAGGQAIIALPILHAIRACIRRMREGGVQLDACIGACNNYYQQALSAAVHRESIEHFWSAVEFNRLVKEMKRCE
jgi:hypothetical protein